MINWCTLSRVTRPARAHMQKLSTGARAHTHTRTHRQRRTQMAPRNKKRSGCVSDLPDVSGNFRSMIYMGITSTDQTSIRSTKGARSADRSVTDYLFASRWFSTRHKPIPALFFSFFLLALAFYSRSAHSHKHAHTCTHARTHRIFTQLPNITVGYHIYPRRIAEFKWAIRVLRGATGQVCDPQGGDPIFIQPMTYSEALKQPAEVPRLPSRRLLRQGGV